MEENENKNQNVFSTGDETLESNADVANPRPPDDTGNKTPEQKDHKLGLISRLKNKLADYNIYLLGFLLLLLLGMIGTYLLYQKSKAIDNRQNSSTVEPLSEDALDQLRQTDVSVGDPKQILSVEANAIFAGTVLMKNDLEVAGKLKLGGPLELNGLKSAGVSSFDQLQAQQLEIAGDGKINGQLTVNRGMTVDGNLSVGGALTAQQLLIQNLQIAGDLKLGRHIDAGGAAPSRSNGNALGGGGTTSLSGTDTAGTININTGNRPSSGCLINVTFAQSFNGSPHVMITPVGPAGAGLSYYVNRNQDGFSVCTANSPGSGRSFSFDYIVIN